MLHSKYIILIFTLLLSTNSFANRNTFSHVSIEVNGIYVEDGFLDVYEFELREQNNKAFDIPEKGVFETLPIALIFCIFSLSILAIYRYVLSQK